MHIRISFSPILPEQQDYLVAHLAEAGYEGFEEKPGELVAYARQEAFDGELLRDLAFKYQLHYTMDRIEEQNWNALWESNFAPVNVGGFLTVRAPFHPPQSQTAYEIVIMPKMSFGTGHHATTAMMAEHMQEMELEGRRVFDFGTGTGLLAILAEKMGAASVLATDNDPWSVSNAGENILVNQCERIEVTLSEAVPAGPFDIILANINLHIILEEVEALAAALSPQGQLLVSGFLDSDEDDVQNKAKALGLKFLARKSRNGWLSVRFSC